MKPISEMMLHELNHEIAIRKGFQHTVVAHKYANNTETPIWGYLWQGRIVSLPDWANDITLAINLFYEFPSMSEIWKDLLRKNTYIYTCKVCLFNETILEMGETIQVAICKAWLRWKGENKEC